MFEFLFFAALAALDSHDDDDNTPSGYGALGNDYDGYYDEGNCDDCGDCGW